MNRLRTVAVLISLLSPTVANSIPIGPNGDQDYPDACDNYDVTLKLRYFVLYADDFISFPMLKCLTIKDSEIAEAHVLAFSQLPNLWYLNLQGNYISVQSFFTLGTLSSVRMLILSNQGGTRRICALGIDRVYPQLRYLDLKNTGICEILHNGDYIFPELTHLDVSMNMLGGTKSVDALRSWSNKLTHLYLNDTGISEFSFEGYSGLVSLVLDNNNIKGIGGDHLNLVNFTNLKNLSVAHNKLEFIREGAFRDTVTLQHLDISLNLFQTINSETLKDLHSLQVLILDKNYFKDVPITAPLNITTLSMNTNRIAIKNLTINYLYNLRQLKTLSLTDNQIMNIHTDAFQNQEMLEELYLNGNALSYLPNGWCRPLKNLRYLDLSGNKFTIFESTIHCSVPSLRQIHVNDNPLSFINASTFATLPKHVTVLL
ncbi:podocan-like [Andrena cerasifolii]|uniref:podocan-like n=1 Tax=Andrena cerasifolii TaxID=2819439 RepID=UPI0040384102